MNRIRLFVVVGALLVATAAHAQQLGGSAMQGRVIDDQGAVLPGVSIVITNVDSGTFRETVSGADGTYFANGLQPGRYRIAADLAGFKKATLEDVMLILGTTLTVEIKLEVGGVEETVTVTTEVSQVDLTSAQVGGNVASKEILDLPSPTRNFIAFVAMLPGVQLNPSAEGSDSLSINGQSNNQVNFVLDGGNNTDDNSASASGAQARTPLEAVQEFQVVTNQFDVEFGRTTGGVVNAITKRGANAIRGSGFGYLTNSAMTAVNYFAKSANVEEGDTDKHQYGGTIGGPIMKNKLHFFYSFERYVVGGAITNTFPTRPDLNLTTQQGLNGYNHMIRIDGQINANNTYTGRYLTERQPNRDLYTGDRATATTANYELDEDQTASISYNRVIGNRGLNTIRFSIETEHIRRGAEPGTFLDTQDKTLEAPVLSHLSFDEQGHTNGQTRYAQAPGLDNTFSWFLPTSRGDHDLKSGFQYLYAQNELDEQGSMNGQFTFATDRSYNAADPSTYPERLTIRVPVPGGQSTHIHSIGLFAQDKWRVTNNLTLNMGLRWDADIAPWAQPFNPLIDESATDKNNFQPRFGFAYNLDGKSVIHGGIGRYYEKFFIGQFSPLQSNGVYGASFTVNFPIASADPGPSNGRLPTDAMLVGGPTVNRTLLNQIYPAGTLTRNTATVQYDTPDRQLPRSTQLSFGYSRQFASTMFWAADYIHNVGRGWLAYDLNPGLRINTTRTGPIVRTDLLGLASQLGITPFSNQVLARFTYDGETRYDGLNLQLERRFSGFWGARATYTLGYARGNNNGAPAAVNNYQVLDQKNLDLSEGPLDTDRRHVFVLNGRIDIPGVPGLNVSSLFRYMSGRPFSLIDINVDVDRNGVLQDPLPAGDYSGTGANSVSVKNDGGRNGAYGPDYAQMDLRVSYRIKMGADFRRLDVFAEVFNLLDRANFTNPSGDRRLPTFLVLNGLVAGGFPRQLQIGARFGF